MTSTKIRDKFRPQPLANIEPQTTTEHLNHNRTHESQAQQVTNFPNCASMTGLLGDGELGVVCWYAEKKERELRDNLRVG